MAALLSATVASEAVEGVKVSGHVDAGFAVESGGDHGFGLGQAYLGLSRSLGSGRALIGLGTSSRSSPSESFGLAPSSQAFVEARSEGGLFGRLGRWSSPFGYESPWSPENRFTSTGALELALPAAFTGILAGYEFSEVLEFSVWVANRQEAVAAGFAATNPDVGFRVASRLESLQASIGGLIGRGFGAEWLFDVQVGGRLGDFSAAFDMAFHKLAASQVGLLKGLIVSYDFMPGWAAATRTELLKNVRSEDTEVSSSLGLQYRPTPGASFRVDYLWRRANDRPVTHRIGVSAVHAF